MRFWIELAGVPIGTAELEPREVAVGTFEALPAYAAVRAAFREGGNALWDLLRREHQSVRGRRWRARLVTRMQERCRTLALRTPSGLGVSATRVFLFDSDRQPGPPVLVVHFGEASALTGAAAEVPPGTAGESARPAA